MFNFTQILMRFPGLRNIHVKFHLRNLALCVLALGDNQRPDVSEKWYWKILRETLAPASVKEVFVKSLAATFQSLRYELPGRKITTSLLLVEHMHPPRIVPPFGLLTAPIVSRPLEIPSANDVLPLVKAQMAKSAAAGWSWRFIREIVDGN